MSKITNNTTVVSHSNLETGAIPQNIQTIIIKKITDSNIVFKFGKYFATTELYKNVGINENLATVYKVQETERIQASEVKGKKNVGILAEKYGAIQVYSKEYINWEDNDFVEHFTDDFVKSFNAKVNSEILPKLLASATAESKVVDGDLNVETLTTALSAVMENYSDEELTALFSRTDSLKVKLMKDSSGHTPLYDMATNKFLDVDVEFLKAVQKGFAYIISGENAFGYIFPRDIEVTVSTESQITSKTNSDGSNINIYEQDLVAVKVVYYFGASILSNDAVAVVKPAVTPAPKP